MSGQQYCESDRTPADYADFDTIVRLTDDGLVDVSDDREYAQ